MKLRSIIYATIVATSLGQMTSVIAEDMTGLPAVETQNGVTYLSGGIGIDGVTAMKAAAKDYSLMLTCSLQGSGQYLADVKVSIADKSGAVVLDTATNGPILLVQLAPGQYHIRAESNGVVLDKDVQIGANIPVKLSLYWPARDVNEQ